MASKEEPIHLDGGTLEGGGQLIRIALGLSALAKVPIHITNIRGNRAKGGGLRNQHLACVEALARACDAEVTGAFKGSKEVNFRPGEGGGKREVFYRYREGRKNQKVGEDGDGAGEEAHWTTCIDIGSAGHTGLVMQAVLPFILFSPPKDEDGRVSKAPVHLTLEGGTNVPGGPSVDYIRQVLMPTLQRIGFAGFEVRDLQRGWLSGGAGGFTLVIWPRLEPGPLPAFRLALYPDQLAAERGETETRKNDTPPQKNPNAPDPQPPSEAPLDPKTRSFALHATVLAPAGLHDAFRNILADPTEFGGFVVGSPPPDQPLCTTTFESTNHPKHTHIYCLLTATVAHASSIATGSPNDPCPVGHADVFGHDFLTSSALPAILRAHVLEASKALANNLRARASVDEFVRDQLVVFQALAEGKSRLFDGVGKGQGSLHAQTAEWVCERVLGERFVGFDGEGGCEGVGLVDGEMRLGGVESRAKEKQDGDVGLFKEKFDNIFVEEAG